MKGRRKSSLARGRRILERIAALSAEAPGVLEVKDEPEVGDVVAACLPVVMMTGFNSASSLWASFPCHQSVFRANPSDWASWGR